MIMLFPGLQFFNSFSFLLGQNPTRPCPIWPPAGSIIVSASAFRLPGFQSCSATLHYGVVSVKCNLSLNPPLPSLLPPDYVLLTLMSLFKSPIPGGLSPSPTQTSFSLVYVSIVPCIFLLWHLSHLRSPKYFLTSWKDPSSLSQGRHASYSPWYPQLTHGAWRLLTLDDC